MHNFQEYINKEISNLLNKPKTPMTISRSARSSRIAQETPYVRSLTKNQNTYWKTFSREKPENNNEIYAQDKKNNKQKVKRCQSAFYRNLLKAEQRLNLKQIPKRKQTSSNRQRQDSQATTSTHRRQILDSHFQARKIEDLVNLQLMKRQSSTLSDNYLKAKLQFSKKRPISTFSTLKLTKI